MPKLIPDAKTISFPLQNNSYERIQWAYNSRSRRAMRFGWGTIYNYFSSKDMLVASIMAEDWLTSLRNMQNSCKVSSTIEQGVKAIYYEIHVYVQLMKKFGRNTKVSQVDLSGDICCCELTYRIY